ncbi:hypothetical protein CYMTET_15820 [Cymbomonas tetramitiformis]|uniref:Neutral ceramidase n=1 Tax=Cymbomonas tetramitiformis TaxID=36881 RepID=A0AAE0L8J4_9CHLO|nr:hypothetical protein CYMTET_15820 [Cymbomonas tetramitiformis]
MKLHTPFAALLLLLQVGQVWATQYLIGAGRFDITGPAADVNMMGYSMTSQTTAGVHTRQYSRAFIFAEPQPAGKRVVYVSIDACMTSQLVTIRVLEKLAEKYGDLYSANNVVISGIHTHAGPGGYLQYILYTVSALGFVKESFDVLVSGIVESVVLAHEDLQPGRALINEGELLDASINRSPTSYLLNPAEERAKYQHDTDKAMTQLRLQNSMGEDVGGMNFFAVHCTSLPVENKLISSDNKGAAALMMESSHQPATNRSQFVAAFGQANPGDISPNTLGAFCTDTGLPCQKEKSTCNGRSEKCRGRGPGYPDFFSSTHIIAEKQATKAKELFDTATEELEGGIDSRQMWVDMSSYKVHLADGTNVSTCKASIGYSLAAGTTDGPGAFDFTQGTTSSNPFWSAISHLLKKPSKEITECQGKKPILLPTGEMTEPYDWDPAIVSVSLLRVGNLLIAAVPVELTTMSGRRLKETVRAAAEDAFGAKLHVVIAGLSNTYASYTATPEEYDAQRYEAASTLYGPNTLAAWQQQFTYLTRAMAKGTSVPAGPSPPDLESKQWSFLPGVVADEVPLGKHFGEVSEDVEDKVYHAGDVVSAEFHSSCPRNDLRTGGTFLEVQRLVPGVMKQLRRHVRAQTFTDTWETAYLDNDFGTKFIWSRPASISTHSTAQITWEIPTDVVPGTYRLKHYNAYKPLIGSIKQFSGVSSSFKVATGNSTATQ